MSSSRRLYAGVGADKHTYQVGLENVYQRREVCVPRRRGVAAGLALLLGGTWGGRGGGECDFSMAVHVRFEVRREDAGGVDLLRAGWAPPAC
jgi:hypothetical protein